MDLKAYSQIEDLESLLKTNKIEIPRLRGIDLCTEMTPWTDEEVKDNLRQIEIDCCEELCESDPFWNPHAKSSVLNDHTHHLKDYYMEKGEPNEHGVCHYISIRWDKIHGWKRRVLKTYIHNQKKAFLKYVERYNFYCGKENIVRVHSRMGGSNWTWDDADWIKRRNEIIASPWFIERVNDWWDTTYCDFYCRV